MSTRAKPTRRGRRHAGNPERWLDIFQDPMAFGVVDEKPAIVKAEEAQEEEGAAADDEDEDDDIGEAEAQEGERGDYLGRTLEERVEAAKRHAATRKRKTADDSVDPLLLLCTRYAEHRGEMALLADLLAYIRTWLSTNLSPEPFQALTSFFLKEREVNAETCVENLPKGARTNFLCGMIKTWRQARTKDEPMSEPEVRRAWRTVADAIRAPNECDVGLRAALIDRMDRTLRELIEAGLPINSQPNGPSMVAMCAGMGAEHLPTISMLYLSGANVQLPNSKDGTLPIEIAAAMGHTTVVRRLYEMGSCVGDAAQYALTESQLETLKLLIG